MGGGSEYVGGGGNDGCDFALFANWNKVSTGLSGNRLTPYSHTQVTCREGVLVTISIT